MMNWADEPTNAKLHDWLIRPKKKPIQCKPPTLNINKTKSKDKEKERVQITWTVSDIAKAGRLLTTPPLSTNFEDEQEMRRVYTLIYDVFRYKNALAQALNDIAFFLLNPELKKTAPHVWLLSYDLYHRGFKKRETAVATTAQNLFKEAGLTKAENALWALRTKLAASISRLRIENNAYSLSDLLPPHLQDAKITSQISRAPVTCWVNTRKVKSADELKRQIENTFNVTLVEDAEELRPNEYKWDKHCPQIIAFHGSMRVELARSDLVKNFKLIVQDKSFCLGPATFVKIVTDLELTGSVIQTHVNSPRTTAYLATILSQNEKIKKLMAFSAGQRKVEYETYFNQLGMTNILIFADRLVDISPNINYMEEVVAVFASPPNSYSAVNDPIDLVCSRGGDLSMLEILTESEETKAGKERALNILEEQRKTLRFAMSKPQIQFVLYETHSELEAENNGMVQKTIKEINKIAKLHHAALQGKLDAPPANTELEPPKEITSSMNIVSFDEKESDISFVESDGPSSTSLKTSKLSISSDDKIFQNIEVPDTDIFDTPSLPSLCPSDNSCLNFTKEGCYLALLQRKQVIKLDNKYMIQMAENRGLFGKSASSSSKPKSRGSRKKQEKPPSPQHKTKKRIRETEMARISAPTQSFLRHTKVIEEVGKCPRCQKGEDDSHHKTPMYRQWWSETTRHIMALRSNLIKNKVIPPSKSKGLDEKAVVNHIVYNSSKIDEIVARSRGPDNNKVPIFPKLKLTREGAKVDKVQLHLPITMVQFV